MLGCGILKYKFKLFFMDCWKYFIIIIIKFGFKVTFYFKCFKKGLFY